MSVRKRSDHWHYDFSVRGVRYRAAIPEARTKAQALRAEADARESVFEGRYGNGGGPSVGFSTFVEQTFLPWARGAKSKPALQNTLTYCRALTDFFKNRPFDDLSPILIEKFKRRRADTPTPTGGNRAAQTVNHELVCLSRICEMAIDAGLLAANPCRRVKKLRVDNARIRYLTPDEETRLLAACTGRRAHLAGIVGIALHTGMRRGEILGLTWSRVDFERRIIFLTKTKTGRNRTVPINDALFEILQTLRAVGSAEWVVTHPGHPDRPLTEFKRAWSEACRAAGIVGLRFHDLRHTTPTRLAEAGVDAFLIREILGHSDLKMTARYTHAAEDRKREAMSRLVPGTVSAFRTALPK